MGDCGSVGPAERLCPYCTHKSDHDDKAADHDQKPGRRQAGKGRFVSEGNIYRIWDSQIVDDSLGELQQTCGLVRRRKASTKVRMNNSFGSSPQNPSPVAMLFRD